MKEDSLGAYQNDLDELDDLEDIRYENIFKVYQKSNKYFYNILKKVSFDEGVNDMAYDVVKVRNDTSWPLLSYKTYKTTELWWLIASINGIVNPLNGISGGAIIKIVKPGYVRMLLEELNDEISPTL